MTKKRKIALTVCIILLVLLCGYTVFSYFKEKHDTKVMYEQAYSNARQNIRDKYGFDAEFYESDEDKYFNSAYAEIGYIQFSAKYDGKEFFVISDCKKENPVSIDDYQYEEVKSALASEISEELQGGEFVKLSLWEYSPWGYDYFGTYSNFYGFHTFYDGTNLDKVLENCSGSLNMVFADTEFSDVPIADRLQALNIDFELTSFDTKEHLEEFCQNSSESYTDDYYRFKLFAPYITDHYKIKDGEVRRLDIKFQEYDDFMYSYFSASAGNWDFPVSKDMPVTERSFKTGYVSRMYEYNGEGEYISKPLTNEYNFDCPHGDVYVYYPLDALEKYGLELENIGAAWFSHGGGSNYANVEKMTVCGDYAVFCLPNEDISFVLVDTSGFDEYVPVGKTDK